VIDSIVELSLRYGIVTPYTAYLVQEPEMGVALPFAPETGPVSQGAGGGGPMAMAPAARAYAADAAEAAAAMPASGEAAVSASEAQNSMQRATSVENIAAAHFVAGKTFVQQGWVSGDDGISLPLWVDTAYTQEMSLMWVEFASDEYFALAAQPNMAEWLAVGQEIVIVVTDTQAIRVTTNREEMSREGNTPLSPLATPVADETVAPSQGASTGRSTETSGKEEQSGWNAFWSWIWGN
jgi:Ca-activated chloride channel family protein